MVDWGGDVESSHQGTEGPGRATDVPRPARSGVGDGSHRSTWSVRLDGTRREEGGDDPRSGKFGGESAVTELFEGTVRSDKGGRLRVEEGLFLIGKFFDTTSYVFTAF